MMRALKFESRVFAISGHPYRQMTTTIQSTGTTAKLIDGTAIAK